MESAQNGPLPEEQQANAETRFMIQVGWKSRSWSFDHGGDLLVVGDWNHGISWLSIQLGMSSSQLTNSYFSEELKPPPTRLILFNIIHHLSLHDILEKGRLTNSIWLFAIADFASANCWSLWFWPCLVLVGNAWFRSCLECSSGCWSTHTCIPLVIKHG